MGQYFGCEFIFDGVPSGNFDLRISDFKSSGVDDYDAGSKADIIQKKIYRRSRPYYYGRSTNTNLEFDITVTSANPISALDRSVINSWMLGRVEYLPFQIIQSDMSTITYYVIFEKASNKYVGNINRGMTFHAVCRDPWGFGDEVRVVKNYVSFANEVWHCMNESDDNDYLRPEISFTINAIANSFSLTNHTDSSRRFEFINLSALETITVNNDLEIISSSTGLLRMEKFNKKFFRLLPGMNIITIYGGISNFTMTYLPARK